MSVEHYTGQPIDKLHYVGVSDIPSFLNRVQDYIFDDHAGVSSGQGIAYEPVALPSQDHELETVSQDKALVKKWWILAAAAAVAGYFLLRGKANA